MSHASAQRQAAAEVEVAIEWPANDPELLATLPPVLRAIVRALGFGRAREWLADNGGVPWNVPAFRVTSRGLEADELTRLRRALLPHMDAAGRVTLPKADKLFLRIRDTQIRKERPYTSLNKLARAYNLTVRQITNICGEETDDDGRQVDLF